MYIYYRILGAEPNDSDTRIRGCYLEQVKMYPPETSPEPFKILTVAYDAIKDERSRVKTALFGTSDAAQPEEIIQGAKLSFQIKKRPPTLGELVQIEKEGKNFLEQGGRGTRYNS